MQCVGEIVSDLQTYLENMESVVSSGVSHSSDRKQYLSAVACMVPGKCSSVVFVPPKFYFFLVSVSLASLALTLVISSCSAPKCFDLALKCLGNLLPSYMRCLPNTQAKSAGMIFHLCDIFYDLTNAFPASDRKPVDHTFSQVLTLLMSKKFACQIKPL
jgi:hypothetical protein